MSKLGEHGNGSVLVPGPDQTHCEDDDRPRPTPSRVSAQSCPTPPHPLEQHSHDALVPETPKSASCLRPLPATLESLPAELRTQVLSYITDLNDLRAVVHASPVLHQQYVRDRHRFLDQSLRATLGSVSLDAYILRASAAVADKRREMPQRSQKRDVSHVTGEYDELRWLVPGTVFARWGSIDDLAAIASFYLTVALPLVLECASRFIANLDPETPPRLGALGTTERTRLLRALYRFQIFQNLYGSPEPDDNSSEALVMSTFFELFLPWEIEEINCINHLVRDKYDAVFDDIRWDVNKQHPRFGERTTPMTPKGAFGLDTEHINRKSLQDGTVSCGLKLFRNVLKTNNHEELVKLMQQHMTWALGHTIHNLLHNLGQGIRRQQFPGSERDTAEAARQALPFLGDKEEGPPLAWVTIWRGTYSNTYGYLIPESFHTWGYVFWDAQRLAGSGGKQELQRVWAAEWGEADPRDLWTRD